MSIIIAVNFPGIELIYGEAAGPAVEELADGTVIYGEDGRATRRHDVDRLMRPSAAAALVEGVVNVAEAQSGDRQPDTLALQAIGQRSAGASRTRRDRDQDRDEQRPESEAQEEQTNAPAAHALIPSGWPVSPA